MGPIVAVCTGNICRSPIAEGLLRKALAAAGLSSVEVVSAGVSAYDGMPASPYAVKAAERVGTDIKAHHSQQLTPDLVKKAGLILVMTKMHKMMVQQEFGPVKAPIFLWREHMESDQQIPDPYGCDEEVYRKCLDSIAEAVPDWVDYIKKQSGK